MTPAKIRTAALALFAALAVSGFAWAGSLTLLGAGKPPGGGGGGTLSTVYNTTSNITGGDDGNGDADASFVVILPSATLSAPSGGTPTTFRVTILWGASSPSEVGALQALYCGRGAPTGNAYSFANAPTQVKFGGGNTANASAGGSVLSDFVALPETFDNTKPFNCSWYINVGSNSHMAEGPATGTVTWLFKTGNDASTQVKSGYTQITAGSSGVFIAKIETQ